jgi:protoporphyrinogen oxidase
MSNLSRRTFLALSATALAGCLRTPSPKRAFTGRLLGPNASAGHLLRNPSLFPSFPSAKLQSEKTRIVIVGGGIAGLSAARQLQRRGFDDFILLELESETGGNSRFVETPVSPAPWGAHYVPLPGPECQPVLDLFKELGVVTGADSIGRPIYNEFFLCAEPSERLFIRGRWQDGLVPTIGISADDKRQFDAFAALMEEFKNARGADGKRAFAIPVDASSRDPKFTILDEKTISEFLRERGWNSEPLRWYVDYCCRDDFGAHAEQISAWAGIHYFASRGGAAANANSQTVVTWPEGNGWLARKLREPLTQKIRANSLVYKITQESNRVLVDVVDSVSMETRRYEADRVIFCGPRFVAHRVIDELKSTPCPVQHYAPWMVANITLKRAPAGYDTELAWDNVFYDNPSLGYVVATHQNPARSQRKTVITYYHALCQNAPAEERAAAQKRTYETWCDWILTDLKKAHPDIGSDIENLDVWLWGHGMVAPTRGFVWGAARASMQSALGRIHFAHSDMSGLSLFEEAYIHGQRAANAVFAEVT